MKHKLYLSLLIILFHLHLSAQEKRINAFNELLQYYEQDNLKFNSKEQVFDIIATRRSVKFSSGAKLSYYLSGRKTINGIKECKNYCKVFNEISSFFENENDDNVTAMKKADLDLYISFLGGLSVELTLIKNNAVLEKSNEQEILSHIKNQVPFFQKISSFILYCINPDGSKYNSYKMDRKSDGSFSSYKYTPPVIPKEPKPKEYKYSYKDINDVWKTGYSRSYAKDSEFNKPPSESFELFQIDDAKSILNGKQFLFKDASGNTSIIRFFDNYLYEISGSNKTKIEIKYSEAGYNYTDPLLKRIVPKKLQYSSKNFVPDMDKGFWVTKHPNGSLYLISNDNSYVPAKTGIYGSLTLLPEGYSKSSSTNKVAYLHSADNLWPNVPYRFIEYTKHGFETREGQLIEKVTNGDFKGIGNSRMVLEEFRAFHNSILWVIGNRYKDFLSEKSITLKYDYVVTTTTTYNSGYEDSSSTSQDLIIEIEPRFEKKYKEYFDKHHYSFMGYNRFKKTFKRYFETIEGYNDPLLQQLLDNLYRFSMELEPKVWCGDSNKIKNGYTYWTMKKN